MEVQDRQYKRKQQQKSDEIELSKYQEYKHKTFEDKKLVEKVRKCYRDCVVKGQNIKDVRFYQHYLKNSDYGKRQGDEARKLKTGKDQE